MIIEEFKTKQLFNRNQLVLLDKEGRIVDSCDTIFSTIHLRRQPVFKWFPLIESIFQELVGLKVEGPELRFAKIEKPSSLLPGYYDFLFRCVPANQEEYILWSILDFTLFYQDFIKYQQHRNEMEIRRQSINSSYFFHPQENNGTSQPLFDFSHSDSLKLSYFHIVNDVIQSPVNLLDGLNVNFRRLSKKDDDLEILNTLGASADFLKRVISEFKQIPKLFNDDWENTPIRSFNTLSLSQAILEKAASGRTVDQPFSWTIDPAIPKELPVNPIRFCQIFFGLLTNAKNYGQKANLKAGLKSTMTKDKCKIQIWITEKMMEEQTVFLPAGEDSAHFVFLVLRLSVIKKLLSNIGGKIMAEEDAQAHSVKIFCEIPFLLSDTQQIPVSDR